LTTKRICSTMTRL